MLASPTPTWQSGEVLLDQYKVIGILGQGGIGTVYHIHHQGWGIDLALKCPRPGLFAQESGKEQFLHEAETWVDLELHPNIVSCYYARTIGGLPCIFAEYVAGGNLSTWIRLRRLYEGGPEQALERLLDIAIQMAWGLHSAHEEGLVHQDVKPANVMMTPEGIAKVTDFGLAKARAMAGEGAHPSSGQEQSILVSWGGMTPAYCSPEQATCQPLSRKTDIWSWGVSVLHMLIGNVTWMAGVLAQQVMAGYQQGQPRPNPLLPPVPDDLAKLLAWCFRSRPQERPATLLEVAAVLQTIYAREVGRPFPRQLPPPLNTRADRLNNRALSLYDLGNNEQAEQVWEQALRVDPGHLESTFNRGVVLWRRGALADDRLVAQMELIRATQRQLWRAAYLLAQIHLERGDGETALPLLEAALRQAPGERAIEALFKQSQVDHAPFACSLGSLQGHTGAVRAVALSSDNRLVASASVDQTIRLWDSATGRWLQVLQGHSQGVKSIDLSADGSLVVSGSADQTVRLWETATGRCLRVFQTGAPVEAVALSADGSRIVASVGSYDLSSGRAVVKDSTIHMWDTASGRHLRAFWGHAKPAASICLSSDGRFLVSSEGAVDSEAGFTFRVWEVATGRCIHAFQGHTQGVPSICLSVDGRFLVSGSLDRTIRLWDTATGRGAYLLQDDLQPVNAVSLSADGHWLAASDWSTTVRLWELEWELQAHEPSDWDEGAQPFLELFLTRHTPCTGQLLRDRQPSDKEIRQALSRQGIPTWDGQEFQAFLQQLRDAGYGWLRPEGVQRKLEEAASSRSRRGRLWSGLFGSR